MLPKANYAKLLKAIQFASEKHKHQKRKGKEGVPFINHPIQVANILSETAAITDENLLMAAILHDTIEDTQTYPEEIELLFGNEVKRLVLEVTDDMSLPCQERKRLQIINAKALSSKAKLLRIADKICNVKDILYSPPSWSTQRKLEYLNWAEEVVVQIENIHPGLNKLFNSYLAKSRQELAKMYVLEQN
ncbi:HD domain-containing protein [Rapidithrix thailandica]|uniref:HD domain-containing protein n=1 Tax=Rapidithrix thailandica TaxID=413964 RepID=A0AAW9RZE1_9BACT